MTFYEALSAYYDEIFPVDARDMAFIASLVHGKGDLLDIGCGTGNKTVFLNGGGSVTGIDGDHAMIERARQDNPGAHIAYDVLDMTALASRFAPATLGAAVCLGNTLVHLPNAAIQPFCDSVRQLLRPGGVFICQILNYTRILDANVTELPVIETPHVRFSRFYERSGDRLDFIMELHLSGSGETLRDSVPLYPLRPEQLHEALRRAGFSRQDAYGSFTGEAFSEDAFLLISAATV